MSKAEADEHKAAPSIIKVLDYLEVHNDSNRNEISRGGGASLPAVDRAVKYLIRRNLLEVSQGRANSKVHHLKALDTGGYKKWLLLKHGI
jgi:DNA-binding MarR family transcriptional regulator